MSEFKRIDALAKFISVFGSASETIRSIQKFIDSHPEHHSIQECDVSPAESINRILDSVACDETGKEIDKIIRNL